MLLLFLKDLKHRWFEYLLGAVIISVVTAAMIVERSVTSSAEKEIHTLAHKLGKNMLVLSEETDMADLASMGIVNKNNGNWHVTNFEKRQEAISGAERVKRHRERKQKQQYYGNGNDTVTTCYGDTDTELTETEKNTANADTGIPSNLGEWLKLLKNGSNKQAILMRMTKTLYPDLVEYPKYSYIGKVARDVGGAGRLAALLWECVPRDPKGDILSYIKQYSKGNKELSRDVNEELEKAGYVRR